MNPKLKLKLKIEAGIPIPPRGNLKPIPTITDVMRKMKVGDSIAFPRKLYNKVAALGVQAIGKGCIAIRTITPTTIRLWRTK